MTYTVSVDHIKTQFGRCHQSVIDSLGGGRFLTRSADPDRDLRQAWQELYGVRVHTGTGWGNWEALEFPSEQHYALWLMKWS